MQPSYHSSELPEKDEFKEFPAAKGNRDMAIEMRKSNIFHVITNTFKTYYRLKKIDNYQRDLKQVRKSSL